MRHFHIRKNQHHMPTVNLDRLWTLVTEQTQQKYKNHPENKVPVIDVVRAVSNCFLKTCIRRCCLTVFLKFSNSKKYLDF